jgi:hypothetical protein
MPPTGAPIAGTPHAFASITMFGRPSNFEGTTSTSIARSALETSGTREVSHFAAGLASGKSAASHPSFVKTRGFRIPKMRL